MPDDTHSAYRYCQSLVKGLDLLAALNRQASGTASISDLARHTSMHRTTVKRLLETLRDQGYLSHDAQSNHYRLTFRVQQLSYGFRDSVSISEIAWPFMRQLSKDIVWPCTIVAPEGDEMVVRASTRSYSPLSFHPGMPGRRLPMLATAAGRAYLAHAPDEERMTLIEMLRGRDDEQGVHARNQAWIDEELESTRARGYSVALGEWREEPKFGGIGVPLRHHERVLACLTVVFLRRAVKQQSALRRIAAALCETALQIERAAAEALR